MLPIRLYVAALSGICVLALSACGGSGDGTAIPRSNNVVASAPVIVTACASGFGGTDIAMQNGSPHDAFIPAGPIVEHFSGVSPGSGPCNFGSALPAIALDAQASWGAAVDNRGNLYVAAGPQALTEILKIAPPYTGTPAVFYSGARNLRSLAVAGNTLYAADFCAGDILRFNLKAGSQSVSTFARVPGVFGIFAAGVDDLYVTSNAGYTGCSEGVGTDSVEHVTKLGAQTIATGLSFPEGLSGNDSSLYIAAGSVVYTVPLAGGSPVLYAGSPILFTHGVIVWKGAGYVTDSNDSGHVFKFTVP